MSGGGQQVVLIAGPTATGKSQLALTVAEATGGVVVNADAMQLYRELRILSARPKREAEARVPHRLYGVLGAHETGSVGRWLSMAREVLANCESRGRPAIVVGGTGLYFQALEYGLSPVPPIPQEVRSRYRARLQNDGSAVLHRELATRAPEEAAGIPASDGQRIARALEVLEATGRGLKAHHRDAAETSVLSGADVARIWLMPDRSALYARCDERFERMMEEGALDEVRHLLAMDVDPELPAMKAIGVRPLARHLVERLPLEEAVRLAKRDTRRYAKRQLTWCRHRMSDWPTVATGDEAVALLLYATGSATT